MPDAKLIADIIKSAKKIQELYEEVNRTRDENRQAWEQATRVYHARYDALAFPGGLEAGMKAALAEHHPKAIAIAITYLAADPYFSRSGYIKQEIAHKLKSAPLQERDRKELQEVLVKLLCKPRRREYSAYARLARVIADD